MIRFTLLVAILYAMCCAMAFGQTAPSPGREPAPPRAAAREEGNSKPLDSSKEDPEQRLTYGSVNIMAVPKKQPRTLKKHDLVTIIVREESQASINGTTDLKRTSDIDAKIDSFVKLNLAKLSLDAKSPAVAPEVKGEFSRNFKGDAQIDRTDSFTARIGAEVLDIRPNGTLVLQAHKHIKTDEEEQEFTLSGTCRAEDVGPDNTVLSNILHELDVKKSTKGAATSTNKRGGLGRLLDFFNPF